MMGVNLGKNKLSGHPVGDYVSGVKVFGKVADYLVINISSPNTPGLRDMQGRKQLEELLDQVGCVCVWVCVCVCVCVWVGVCVGGWMCVYMCVCL